jgi:hypothetical protein
MCTYRYLAVWLKSFGLDLDYFIVYLNLPVVYGFDSDP